MEKENSASGGGGGGGGGGGAEAASATSGATSTSEKLQADQANPLLDPTALFGAYWPRGDSAASSLFGGMPGGYGLGAPHLPSAYAILGRGGSAPGFGGHTPASAPPPSPYPHSSLGTLSVAASQAASLGINPAASAWWTMASHLAAQDYLARLQGAAGLPGFPPGAESLLPPYPASLLNPPSLSSHKSSKSKSSKSHKTPASSSSSTTPSMTSSSLPAVSTQPSVTSSHHSTPVSSTPNSQSNVVSSAKEGSDPSSILGGVRLPPDTEIIKYTSSIVGPKVPGTTNRGRKKTISLDTPSVSVHPPPVPTLSAHQTNTTSSSSLMMEPRKYNRTTDSNEYRDSVDRVEVIKLPAHSTNGSVLSAPPTYTSSSSNSGSSNVNNNINDSDAPLNLSLKPATTSSSSPISGSQPLSQLSNLSQSLLASDRTSRRKPGPKPRRVPQNSVPVPASPSPSLAQLFAAADSPQRPSSGSEESESASTTTHHKDGRPRNLGRGVSKPKKNTVASLLAQSRALGIKPTPALDPTVPLSHQVSLLRSNILAAQMQVATGQSDDKSQKSLQEKMKNKLLEASGEESNMDVTSESGSNTDVVTDTDDDNAEGTPSAKRRKLRPSERDLQIPLERGWKRETVIKGLGKTGVIKGDVSYYSPCGKTFRSSPDLVKFLEQQNPAELTTANFSFSSRPLVGEFLQPTMGLAEAEFVRLGAQEVARRLEELKAVSGFRDARTNNQYERDKLAYAKKLAKEEAQRHKEQARLIKEQEKTERLEAVRREREIRNQQLLEGRKRLAFTIKQKMKIIQEIERGKSKSDVARELGLASSTVATIWKNRESIAESWRNRDMMHQTDVEDVPPKKSPSMSSLVSTTAALCTPVAMTTMTTTTTAITTMPSLVSGVVVPPPQVQVVPPVLPPPPYPTLTLPPASTGLVPSSQPMTTSISSSNLSSITTSTGTTTTTMPPDNTQQAQTQTQSQELLEARKKRQEEVEKIRLEEQQRKQQERELKRQQAVMLKEQMYMQELTKQREMLYTVELERERRRQHMALVRALENRRKMEEKEKKRLEARAERIATKEKRAEQRRVEMELIEQIRKPVEDMELTDHRPLPEIKRIPGLKLSGQAFADIVMVFEFLHNFGETLGFDMESLPSLKSLQLALLNDEEAEEEMLSVMTHLLVCAIEDPGIPQPARHTTGLGQSLRQADITHANISEVLRIYLYANATGEVKALTGVCLERERDKKFADHHQNGGDYASTCSGKNAQFYEHLHNNETWKMSERLRDKPFLALNPTHKAQMLAFLCNELLQNKAVIRQIEGSLETVAQLRKERFVLDTKIRKLRQLHSRKVRMEAVGVIVNKIGDTITIEKKEGEEEGNTTSTAVGTTPTPDEIHHEDEVEDMSENESEGTQPEEEEDKNLSGEELGKKLDKLLKQSEEQLQKLNSSSKQLRAHIFGQDRYWRRYWELACSGGIFVEAMESAEPEVLELQAELDEKYKNMPVEEKSEVKQEGDNKMNFENRENEAPNEVKNEKKHNLNEQNKDTKSHGDKVKSEMDEVNCKKEPVQNCGSENSEGVKEEKKNNDADSTMTDAKTNVTSEEIKQETEVNTDVNMKEEVKKENEETDEDMTKPLVKMMEDKIVETIPNGDKFNHVNNLHNGKELNGSFISIMSIISDNSNPEPNWFSILPRETCDTPGPSTKQIFGIAEPTELRIPVFPPPASPSYDRCDSPAPLILTQDEAVQLEYLKVHGLPPPGEAKPVPKDLRYGWWRITDVDTFQELLEHLHSRGVREKELKRTTWATMESFLAVTGKINVDPGNMAATELQVEPDDPNTPIPKPDNPSNWGEQVALRVDAQLLEQVEALEDKVANASMQVKGWKLPPRAGTEEAEEIDKLNEMEKISAVEQARQRLLSLEAAIERRYLKPPLGVCTGDPNLAALKAEQAAAANANSNNSEQNNQAPAPPEETTPRGLNTWREATARAHTSAQLAMALYMLEASIAWDKSIMKAVSLTTARNSVCAKLRNRCVSLKATNQYKQLLTTSQTSNCQFCHSGDNEDKLLLCDGCDRGYHTYCFRPKMENIPDGDWYCHECMNKATGERNCLVCGKRVGKNLVLCELCPRAYHTDCHNPVMPKMPRGKWYCSNCHSKQPKKRNSSRRSHTKGGGTRESESSDHPPASPTPSTASNTHVEDVSSSEPPTPTASPRKEGNNRTLTKKQQRELAPCKILLEQLEQQDEAWPFLLPVNTKQFPTYKKIIKTPMDLSTIKKKLQDSAYKSRDEFCADVRQMFINCEVFNEDDSPVGKAGHGMRSFFEMRWTEITGAPPPHPQTHS
ncbi:bromodomain adjacent to zinc finger domain protein 2B isoform X5 [Monomorium pharaonis]|uniref:bromodomain adjacent to zinc finger domain protein 2B isoform X5 n=1 Tax=Monomorium pharaonis TaxID=307658 RepID=UPI00102E1B7B|nr:bromodomain adjacent to zinc finger domain protein 2B isoform X5 [Monomorium pharaonis]